MRNIQRLGVLVLPVIVGLAACTGKTKSSPSQLDLEYQARSMTQTAQAAGVTNTPWPTPWSTATRVIPRERPTITPYPTRDRSNSTEEPCDNCVVQGDWLYKPFMDENGQQRSLSEFLGRLVILESVSSSCETCGEQQQNIMTAARDRYNYGLLTDTVFVALGVVPGESPSLIKTVLQRQVGPMWGVVPLLQGGDTGGDYVFGVASPDLVAALERDFGAESGDPNSPFVLVIESDGLARRLVQGMVNISDLRDAITDYANTPTPEP
ncbi:MAG TPA: hypothetical protein VMT24_14460 [Aggregatilineaceae bacterium]|jgi:hypothetical protein|nr:hypothetical protein [Aggregatilineaceae bacterium]